jgi:predicted deacylase
VNPGGGEQKTAEKPKFNLAQGEKIAAENNQSQAMRIVNEIPKSRRKEIEEAIEEHRSSDRPQWDRAQGVKQHRFLNKRIKPGTLRTISFPLLEVNLGDSWPTPVTVIHGARPGPVVTITGAVHGDELVGPLACSHLTQPQLTGPGKPLDPLTMAGTLRIAPILNPPGYRSHSRYFPDGRDLNREFPGAEEGNTTQRVAYRIWNELVKGSDYLIDMHSAARGRSNMPQVRANLVDPRSNKLAKSFGVEVLLDSRSPRGSMRRWANDKGIAAMTYEGGGAITLEHEAVQVAVYGVMNVLRSLHVIPGNPSRPRFRLLAAGSIWIRAHEGGLVDLLVHPGSFVEAGETIATILDPQQPDKSEVIEAPERGLLICTATNPFVHAGTPVGHLLPIQKKASVVLEQLDANRILLVSGSQGTPPWREEEEVDEISIEGEWSGGDVDAEWQREWQTPAEAQAHAEEEQ